MQYNTINPSSLQEEFDNNQVVILRFNSAQSKKVLKAIKTHEWHLSLQRHKSWFTHLKYWLLVPWLFGSRLILSKTDPVAADVCRFYRDNRTDIAALDCAVNEAAELQVIIKSKALKAES